MKKLNYEDVKSFIESIDGYTLLSNKYINSKEKLEIKCKNNHIFKMNHSDIKQGKRCSECQGIIRWDFERVKQYIEVDSKLDYKLLSTEYVNMHKKLTIECNKGHIFETSYSSFYHTKTKCPRCQGCGKLSYELVKQYIEIDSISGYKLLSKEYKNNRTKIELLCPEGHEYKVQFSSFQQGNRCKTCAELDKIRRQTHTYDFVKNTIESEQGYKLLSDNYIDNETHLDIMCNSGHVYSTPFANFISGKRCRLCFFIRNSGIGNHKWNPNKTDEDREIKRHIKGYPQWRESVYQRDNYTCQCCRDNKGGNLVAHHKDGYNWCKERRTDVSNGITLCEKCHDNFHSIYGFGDNTEKQYNEWINTNIIQNNLLSQTP